MLRSKIAVFPAAAGGEHQSLLEALRELFPVDFLVGQETDREHCDGALLFGFSLPQALRAAESGRPCLAFVTEPGTASRTPSGDIRFAGFACLPAAFRGRSVRHGAIEKVSRLKEQPGDKVLACSGSHILWIQSPAAPNLHLLAIEPPDLPSNGYLFQFFNRDDWVRLLPLLHWLRELSGLQIPRLRACFMFDDPNLHWKSYGYFHYPTLVEHANTHNYHVAFATVPLDAWYTHRRATALFRSNPHRVSLLVHGNNHTRRELAQVLPDQSRQALVAQALRRIVALEQASGLQIPRVMAAPHGACSEAMATVLLSLGFEAGCISRGSIMAHNKNTVWLRSVGLHLAEFLGTGLPVIPRFGLASDCQNEILLASFLGQPVITVGHHEDVADGLDLLQQLAQQINSLGEVQWTDLGSIARSNFSSQPQGNLLHLKMYSRRVLLTVPDGITQVYVERPWLSKQSAESLLWREGQSSVQRSSSHPLEPIQIRAGAKLEIISILPNAIDPAKVPLKHTSLWVVGRRQLCEARDRLRPTVDRVLSLRRPRFINRKPKVPS